MTTDSSFAQLDPQPKPKTTRPCKACGDDFVKSLPMQRVCSPICARNLVIARKAEKLRKKARYDLQALKRNHRPTMLKRAEAAVNTYVKLRDHDKGCVSCDLPKTWTGQWHASHYRSVGAASSVRFHLWNIHKSCSVCNNWKSGNVIGYTPRLIERIGMEKVLWLTRQNGRVQYHVDYLERLRSVFAKKARRLRERLEARQ